MSAGPSRDRDKNRKYESGAQKRRKIEKRKEAANSQRGSLLKFLTSTATVEPDSEQSEPAPTQKIVSLEEEQQSSPEENCISEQEQQSSPEENGIILEEEQLSSPEEIYNGSNDEFTSFNSFEEYEDEMVRKSPTCLLSDDPGKWPPNLSDAMRTFLVKNKPMQVTEFDFPRNEQGRRFNSAFYHKVLHNGEKVCRSWLIYSRVNNRVYCFYCCLFFNHYTRSGLAKEGICDWKNLGKRLTEHETSDVHRASQLKFLELEKRLKTEQTIDNVTQRQINAEKEHWRGVLKRIIFAIQYLAKHNDALRGSSDKIFTKNNGKFLGLIEMISKFDVLIAEHLRRIGTKEISDHYLGPKIQNELITLMSETVRNEIKLRIKRSKYYSVLLDCTMDKGRIEQLTFIIRIVEMTSDNCAEIKEYFIGFTPVTKSTGLRLTEELKFQLQALDINLSDCRGQAYDNGANMVGKHQGVQTRILTENPRAFFVPCTAHSLNLQLGDMALSVPMAMTFFGTIQRFYTIFAGSAERWDILTKHLPKITLKPLSETRWECRLQSVKPIRFCMSNIHNALIELSETTNDPKIKSEAQSLAEYGMNFEFILATVVWYELLSAINKVSKSLQSIGTDLSMAMSLLSGLEKFLKEFRKNGFATSKKTASEICEENDISPVFKETRTRKRKRLHDYEGEDSTVNDPENNFYINYFLCIVDKGIVSVQERFKQISEHHSNFGFLYDFQKLKSMPDEELEKCCNDLDHLLRDGDNRDIHGVELYEEIKLLRNISGTDATPSFSTPLECLNILHKMPDSFPNLAIALRILLTIPVTTASAERSFSKLKIIKNYLRTTMKEERLSNLTVLSIEHDICESLDYEELINEFAELKARKVKFT